MAVFCFIQFTSISICCREDECFIANDTSVLMADLLSLEDGQDRPGSLYRESPVSVRIFIQNINILIICKVEDVLQKS